MAHTALTISESLLSHRNRCASAPTDPSSLEVTGAPSRSFSFASRTSRALLPAVLLSLISSEHLSLAHLNSGRECHSYAITSSVGPALSPASQVEAAVCVAASSSAGERWISTVLPQLLFTKFQESSRRISEGQKMARKGGQLCFDE
jgi:hypothetical protein